MKAGDDNTITHGTDLGYQQGMQKVCGHSSFIFLRGVNPPEKTDVHVGGRSLCCGSLQDVGCAEAMHSPIDHRIEESLKHMFVGMWVAHPSPKQDELVSMRAGLATYKQQDAWNQMYRSASIHRGAGPASYMT
jgi:hypothetical protein